MAVQPALFGQTNPIPFVSQPLLPETIAPGSSSFTLTVNGGGFVSGSSVNWNNSALVTTFVSSTQLTATVPAPDIATPGTAAITVVNPGSGGGKSNVQYFQIATPISSVPVTGLSAFGFDNPNGGGRYTWGDFNGDGKLDVIGFYPTSASSDLMCVYLGNGDGSFKALPCTNPDTNFDFSPVTGDFNGDGNLDVVVGTCANSSISTCNIAVFLGNGDGTFRGPIDSGVPGPQRFTILTGDFNRDGKLDLILETANTPYDVSLMLGNGDGTFQNPTLLATNGGDIAAADLNGDGILDLAIAPGSILLGNGDGTFTTVSGSPQFVQGVAIADVNGDGKPDLVSITDSSTCTFSVFVGNGDGTFQAPIATTQQNCNSQFLPFADFMVLTDLNNDAKLDVLTALAGGGMEEPICFLGNGDGTFPIMPVGGGPLENGAGEIIAVADFNADGRADILWQPIYTQTLQLLLQGSFPVAELSPSSVPFGAVTVGTSTQPPATVSLTNTGQAAMGVSSVTITGADATDFSETNNCGASLAVAASCQIKITFTPSALGSRMAAVVIANSAAGSPQSVALTGSGTVAVVSFSPTSVSFPNQYVGTSGLPQNVVVTNAGQTSLTFSSVTAGPSDFGVLNNCVNALAPNSSCTIGVFFDPTTSGAITGVLTLTDNATGSPQTIPLSGTGQDFSVTPSASTQTISPGQTANYSVSLMPLGGFTQAVQLSCNGAPAGTSCTVPPSVTLNGSSATSITVSVATTASSAMSPFVGARPGMWLAVIGCLGLVFWGTSTGARTLRRSRVAFAVVFLLGLSVVTLTLACSGASRAAGPPPSTYNLVVTGSFTSTTSGGVTLKHSANLTLVVQ